MKHKEKEINYKDLAIINFYREEFKKHHLQLLRHKKNYSKKTFNEINQALSRLIASIDQIYNLENFEELASELLKKIDIVTQLSLSLDSEDTIN
jgi:hypothetical protein